MGDKDERERRGIKMAELLLTLAETERLVRSPIGTQDASHVALTDGSGGEQTLLPRIEERLRAQCIELCDVMMPTLVAINKSDSAQQLQEMTTSAPTSDGGTLSRIAELPALLLDLKAREKKLVEETATATHETHAQLVVAVARVKEMIALISHVLAQHKQNDQARVLQVKLQWLVRFSNAMRVEAKVLANRLTVEMYPREQIQVLRATRYGKIVNVTGEAS
ncbi:hypothetical protein BBJ28_00005162 [Nothophytophthora sp. Chile5]|nr:hypothetical protein BBJ28_00005162 [Nothophytophthora sp. Chile5]